ncbi:hypothetical protein Tco_0467612 [Tanacetum coccineum]
MCSLLPSRAIVTPCMQNQRPVQSLSLAIDVVLRLVGNKFVYDCVIQFISAAMDSVSSSVRVSRQDLAICGSKKFVRRLSKDIISGLHSKQNSSLRHQELTSPEKWLTAKASTDTDGEVTITAIIDGQSKTITEASLRRHLKLEDHDGITSIPISEIFEQLALMGYQTDSDKLTFQKGVFSPQWRFLIHTLLHCLSPKKTAWEQFSSNIATALYAASKQLGNTTSLG